MGLFSKKTTTHITGVTQRMLDDKHFSFSNKRAMAEYLYKNSPVDISIHKKSLADLMIEHHNHSLPKQFNKLRRYTLKPDKYIFGVPTGTLADKPEEQITDATKSYINGLYPNSTVTYHGFLLSGEDVYYEAWLELAKQYNSTNNTITGFNRNTECYLYDAVLYLTEETIKSYGNLVISNMSLPFNWGKCFDREIDTSRVQTSYEKYHKNLLAVEFHYLENGNVIKESFAIPLEFNSTSDYVYATYKVNDTYHWFKYKYLSGNTTIDSALKGKTGLGEYYPRLYIRLNQADIRYYPDKRYHDDSKKVYKKIGLDLEQLTNQMINSVGHGEWGDVRCLFIHLGLNVNVSNDEQILIEYLYKYFKRLFHSVDSYTGEYTQRVFESDSTAVESRITHSGTYYVQDNVVSHVVSYELIEYRRMQVTSDFDRIPIGKYFTKFYTDYVDVEPRAGNFRLSERNVDSHGFAYRENETTVHIYRVKALTVTIWSYGYEFTRHTDSPELVIPLDKALMNEISAKEEEYIYHKALHVSLIHVKHIKQKWYQTSLFKAILIATAIAITYVSGGTAGASMSAFVKAVVIGTAKAIAINLAVNVALKVAVQAGIIDAKTAVIISALVSIAVGLYSGGTFDFSKLLTAPNMMNALNQSFNAYNKILAIELQDAIKQLEQVKQDYKNFKEKQKAVDTKVLPLDYELLRSNFTPIVNVFETPDMFYNRHYSYDVVAISHGLIDNFVDGTLAIRNVYKPKQETVDDVLII